MNNNVETLSFQMDCEWLCDFIRNRIFYEGKSFSWGVETLEESFGISEEIATEIITGTKTVQGINEGELVDCNKTKEYLEYMQREESNKVKAELELELNLHPIKYVDPFATCYSYKHMKEQIEYYDAPGDIKHLREYFQKEPANSDWLFQGGLYSISLQFVDKKIQTVDDTEAFWKRLYDYWNNELTRNAYCYTSKDITQIKLRQKSYELHLKKEEAKTKFTKDQIDKVVKELAPDKLLNDKKEYTLCDGGEFYYQRKGEYKPLEKGVFHTYGLISPDGDFYSCDFASHHIAAYAICIKNKWIDGTEEDGDPFEQLGHKAKDLLYDKGWVFVRTNGADMFYSKWDEIENMPQRQMDTAYDYVIWDREK